MKSKTEPLTDWTDTSDGGDSSQEDQPEVICEMESSDWSKAPYGPDSLEFEKYQPQKNSKMEQSSEWTDIHRMVLSHLFLKSLNHQNLFVFVLWVYWILPPNRLILHIIPALNLCLIFHSFKIPCRIPNNFLIPC